VRRFLRDWAPLAISLAAAGFTGLQWFEARHQTQLANVSSIGFDIDTDPTERRLGISVRNAGPGIATVRSVSYYVDRKRIEDINAALEKAQLLADHEVGIDMESGEPLAAGETVWVLDYRPKRNDEKQRAMDFIEKHFSVGVEYCAANGQCSRTCSTVDQCQFTGAAVPTAPAAKHLTRVTRAPGSAPPATSSESPWMILITYVGFWSTLVGALTAFTLASLGQWRRTLSARRAAGQLALIALGDMYSTAKWANDEFFDEQRKKWIEAFRREPLYFELKPLPEVLLGEPPTIDIEDLGFLADTHDPDILLRLMDVRQNFAAILKFLRRHEELHHTVQAVMSKDDPTGKKAYRAEDVTSLVGVDVLSQLQSTVDALRIGLPEMCAASMKVSGQLRDVLLYQFPLRSLLQFIPEKRGKLSETPTYARRPALWRRALRQLRRLWDRAFGPGGPPERVMSGKPKAARSP
jgi:hypothetical protein